MDWLQFWPCWRQSRCAGRRCPAWPAASRCSFGCRALAGIAVLLPLLFVWDWGYVGAEAGFSLSYLTSEPFKEWTGLGLPNPVAYLAVLFAGAGRWAWPAVLLPGVWELYRRRATALGRYALVLCLTTLGIYSMYMYQHGRFMAPVVAVLTPFAAVSCVDVARVMRAKRPANLYPSFMKMRSHCSLTISEADTGNGGSASRFAYHFAW